MKLKVTSKLYWQKLYSTKANNTETLICLFIRQISVCVNSNRNVGWAITFSVKDKNLQCHRRKCNCVLQTSASNFLFARSNTYVKHLRLSTPIKHQDDYLTNTKSSCLTIEKLLNSVFISFQMTNK